MHSSEDGSHVQAFSAGEVSCVLSYAFQQVHILAAVHAFWLAHLLTLHPSGVSTGWVRRGGAAAVWTHILSSPAAAFFSSRDGAAGAACRSHLGLALGNRRLEATLCGVAVRLLFVCFRLAGCRSFGASGVAVALHVGQHGHRVEVGADGRLAALDAKAVLLCQILGRLEASKDIRRQRDPAALDDVLRRELPSAAELVGPDTAVVVVRIERAGVHHEHVVLAKVCAQQGGDRVVGCFPFEGDLQSANFLFRVLC